ncbi:hypothetical protein GNI_196050, partial [Gregarina niphandrodes]
NHCTRVFRIRRVGPEPRNQPFANVRKTGDTSLLVFLHRFRNNGSSGRRAPSRNELRFKPFKNSQIIVISENYLIFIGFGYPETAFEGPSDTVITHALQEKASRPLSWLFCKSLQHCQH